MKRLLLFILITSASLNIFVAIWVFRNSSQQRAIEEKVPKLTAVTTRDLPKLYKTGVSIDILDLPPKMNSWNLTTEDWKWFYTNQGENKPLTYNNHYVTIVQLSPSHEKLGFFYRPEDHSLGESVLAVLNIAQKSVKEVYRGDNWTSSWEWKGDETVVVRRSCGTECMVAYVIETSTGKQFETYRVY